MQCSVASTAQMFDMKES